jgi:UDP-4-amino-4,6-dideoxy-N-acetyl-beta-L-altrosamine transaminase
MVAEHGRIAGNDTNIMKIIPYSRQFIDDKDINEVLTVLKSDFLTQGPKVPDFEKRLTKYCGSNHAVVFNSGTSALHGSYFAAGLKKSDEFITSPITFVATANAGLYLGAKPVFADIEKVTGNVDVNKIAKKITKKTKLLVPVHYAGDPARLENIRRLANKYNLFVIEDACHALGAKYKGEKIGNCKYSDMTVLSFHPVKHITTGEGGAVLTNNEEFYKRLLMFRNHGITKDKSRFKTQDSRFLSDWYYEMHYLGYNYRMTDIQAALGISQLKKLDNFVQRRRTIADIYNNSFRDNPYFDISIEEDYACSSYHLYPIRLKDKYYQKKKEIFAQLRMKGFGVQVHYIPVYWQPFYRDMGYKMGSCPIAEDFYKREISIPIYPAMTQGDIKSVTNGILGVFNGS